MRSVFLSLEGILLVLFFLVFFLSCFLEVLVFEKGFYVFFLGNRYEFLRGDIRCSIVRCFLFFVIFIWRKYYRRFFFLDMLKLLNEVYYRLG